VSDLVLNSLNLITDDPHSPINVALLLKPRIKTDRRQHRDRTGNAMLRITQFVVIIGPIIAILPLVFAFIYNQQPLQHEDVSGGLVDLEKSIDTSIPSLFAIADIHGDYPHALAALVHAGVVDEDGNWTAGNSTLVCRVVVETRIQLTLSRSKLVMLSTEVLIHRSCIHG
jgi:hypothetical protein